MHCEGNVVVDAADIAVTVPAVANVETFEFLKILLGQTAIEIGAEAVESDIDEDPEEFPVVVSIVELPDMLEIGDDIVARALVERLPDLVRHQRQGKTEGGELHHALVAGIDRAPIFGMGRITAIRKPFGKAVPVIESVLAGAERCKTPERTSETFKISSGPVEMSAGAIEANTGISIREEGQQRIEEIVDSADHVGAGLQRIACERIGAGGIIGHRHHSQLVGIRNSASCNGNDRLADMAGGRGPVAVAGDQKGDGLAAKRRAVDAHGGKPGIGHDGTGQVIEADDREILGNAKACFGDGFKHADGNEIIHAEGRRVSGIFREHRDRALMRLAAGAALEGKRNEPAFGTGNRGNRCLESSHTFADRVAMRAGEMQDTAMTGFREPARRLVGAEEIGGRDAIEAQAWIGTVDEDGRCSCLFQPGPQRIAGIDADEEKPFGFRRLHIFADNIRRRAVLAHEPHFERHAGIGGTGAKALNNRFVEDAEATGCPVAGNQGKPARNAFRNSLHRIAMFGSDLQNVPPHAFADARFIGEHPRYRGNRNTGQTGNIGLSRSPGLDLIHFNLVHVAKIMQITQICKIIINSCKEKFFAYSSLRHAWKDHWRMAPGIGHRRKSMQVNRRSFLMGTAGAAAGLAFGAGSSIPAFAEDASLRAMWWGSNDRAKRTLDVAKLYQSKTPGVTIVGESLSGDGYWTKLATQMAGRAIADVFQLEPGTISDYSKRGACLPLDEFVPSTLKVDSFGADMLKLTTVDGKLYGVGLGLNSFAMFFDTVEFEKGGYSAADARSHLG